MNWLKRNMFGEINLGCYLFGHNFYLVGEHPFTAVCKRCELDNPKRFTEAHKSEGDENGK